MRITDALLGEHGVLYALFDHIERVLTDARTVEEIRPLCGALETCLHSHARVEDLQLVPALESCPDVETASVGAMRREHENIAQSLSELHGVDDVEKLKLSVAHVLRLARIHFRNEERGLFVEAAERLGRDRLRLLGKQWASVRGVELRDAP